MSTIDILRRETDTRDFKQGETIFTEGEAGNGMFAVVAGGVDIVIKGAVVEHLTPGGVFGEMALIDARPRSATAVAASDCTVALINEKRFLRLVELTPRFALQMMQVISERLRRTETSK